MSEWLARILAGEAGSETAVVERYTQRLLELARRQLPAHVRRRVDPEDVVQSVYRSFFKRLTEDRFAFEESHDIWKLLATMTYHKARNAVIFHQRGRRDVRREATPPPPDASNQPPAEPAVPEPNDAAIDTLYECLERLLRELPETSRAVVARRLEGESIEEIAQHLGRSRRTVLRVLAHLKDLAARQMEQHHPFTSP